MKHKIKNSVAKFLYDLLFDLPKTEPLRPVCFRCRICGDKIINRLLTQSGRYQSRQWTCKTCGTPYSKEVMEGPILEITLEALKPRRISQAHLRAHLLYQAIKVLVSFIVAVSSFVSILFGGHHG
jgi:hypothetical protein